MRHQGFTLAELLIALAILGVIATFTIPKVLNAQQDGSHLAIAKEAAASVSGAFQAYKIENMPDESTTMADLSPYLNYVSVNSVDTIDHNPLAGTRDCGDGVSHCLQLHNGAILHYGSAIQFDGTTNLNTINFCVDPNGLQGTKSAVCFNLYFNGRLTTRGQALPNSCNNQACPFGPTAFIDPSWFSWN